MKPYIAFSASFEGRAGEIPAFSPQSGCEAFWRSWKAHTALDSRAASVRNGIDHLKRRGDAS